MSNLYWMAKRTILVTTKKNEDLKWLLVTCGKLYFCSLQILLTVSFVYLRNACFRVCARTCSKSAKLTMWPTDVVKLKALCRCISHTMHAVGPSLTQLPSHTAVVHETLRGAPDCNRTLSVNAVCHNLDVSNVNQFLNDTNHPNEVSDVLIVCLNFAHHCRSFSSFGRWRSAFRCIPESYSPHVLTEIA